jgi:hypothetical protein
LHRIISTDFEFAIEILDAKELNIIQAAIDFIMTFSFQKVGTVSDVNKRAGTEKSTTISN